MPKRRRNKQRIAEEDRFRSNSAQLDRNNRPTIFMEYYSRTFRLLHLELEQNLDLKKRFDYPHTIRKEFWNNKEGHYNSRDAVPLIDSYLQELASHLSNIISKHSLIYWIHVYRRIAPREIGENEYPATVLQTRATLEAAFHKYAHIGMCDGISLSSEVNINKVLNGRLMSSRLKLERMYIANNPQLVLTKFDLPDLTELYECELLAYEIWRCMALKRIINKGAELIVDESDKVVYDNRSDDLNFLVQSYDNRNERGLSGFVSSKGIIIDYLDDKHSGKIPLLQYNVQLRNVSYLSKLFQDLFNVTLPEVTIQNFVLFVVDARNYYSLHKPLARIFNTKRGFNLASILLFVTMVCIDIATNLAPERYLHFSKFLNHAYDGPFMKQEYLAHLARLKEIARDSLGLEESEISDFNIDLLFDYFCLNESRQNAINLDYAGPFNIFLPLKDKYIADYAWIVRTFTNLFYEIKLDDENFKGKALEELIRRLLPSELQGVCIALDGSKKEIDIAFKCLDKLILIECKAVGMSIAFDRGDKRAIDYRRREVVDRILREADSKASWLANCPKGRNYDISMYKEIIPVGVSPFVEYIHSRELYYWINDRSPRVMTPMELVEAFNNDTFSEVDSNVKKYINSRKYRRLT